MTLVLDPAHMGLCTAAGNDPLALWAAASTPLGMEQRLTHTAALASPGGCHQVLRGVPSMNTSQDSVTRMRALLRGALRHPLPAQALVLWPYHPTSGERARPHPEAFWGWMAEAGLRHPEARWQPVCVDGSDITLLDQARDALSCHPDRTLFLGGVDSLLHPESLLSLVDCQVPLAWDNEDGLVPGEAAVFLPMRDNGRGIHVLGWDSCPEPTPGCGAPDEHPALPQALDSALGQAGLRPSDLDGIVLPPGSGPQGDRAWWSCQARLWPLRADIQKGSPLPPAPDNDLLLPESMTPSTLNSGVATGHAGAVQWLLQLALASIWMRHTRFMVRSGAGPRIATTAVLDCPLGDERGAVILGDETGQDACGQGMPVPPSPQ